MNTMQLNRQLSSRPFGRERPRAFVTCRSPTACQSLRDATTTLLSQSTTDTVHLQNPAEQRQRHGRATPLPPTPLQACAWPERLPGGLLGSAAAIALATTLALGLPAEAAVPAADTAALSIPGIVGDAPLREGFVSGFLLIFFSEIGDKTFFIALLLALKQPKGLVFSGTFGALAVMTVISVALGQVLHQVDELVPEGAGKLPYDDLLAAALLVYFGIKTLQDAKDASESAAEEKEEAAEVVENLGATTSGAPGADGSSSASASAAAASALQLVLSTFALVFAAEWGDKSFLATIALAAASSPLGVTAGAVAGHGVATGLAVAGGGFLSRYFSETVLQYVGGSLFLVFAAATVVDIFV